VETAGPASSVEGVVTRVEQAALTRSKIVATARRLFAERGYFSTGTTDIVVEAGVGTRGALYHHFEDKEALFAAVLEELEADLALTVGAMITGESGFERLRQALLGFLDASLDGEVARILLIDGPAVLGWDRWRQIEARHGLGAIGHLLQAGIDDGTIAAVAVAPSAHLLLSATDEAALFIAHAPDAVSARAEMGATLEALLGGLAAPGSR
jgi:AcrR family transcriptional regulator